MKRTDIFSESCINTGPDAQDVLEGLSALARINAVSAPLDGTNTNWTPGAERIEDLLIANDQLGVVARRWGRRLLERLEGPEAPPVIPGDPNNLRIFARRNRLAPDSTEYTGEQEEGIVSISPMSSAEVAAGRLAMQARSEPSICDEANKFLKASRARATSETAKVEVPARRPIAFMVGHRVTSFAPTGVSAESVSRLTGF